MRELDDDDDDDVEFRPRSRKRKQTGNTRLIIGLIVGVIGGGFLLCGGACVGVFNWALEDTTQTVREGLADNPVIREHIGEVQSFKMQKWASIMHDNEETYLFRIEGSLASGTITADCWPDDEGDDRAYFGVLALDNGETFELIPDLFTEQVRTDIAEHPVIVEHIGEILEFVHDDDRSLEEEGEDVYVFRVRGNKGGGILRAACLTISDEEEDVVSGELILDSGEKIQLFPEKPLD
jgi:hypothetical protein